MIYIMLSQSSGTKSVINEWTKLSEWRVRAHDALMLTGLVATAGAVLGGAAGGAVGAANSIYEEAALSKEHHRRIMNSDSDAIHGIPPLQLKKLHEHFFDPLSISLGGVGAALGALFLGHRVHGSEKRINNNALLFELNHIFGKLNELAPETIANTTLVAKISHGYAGESAFDPLVYKIDLVADGSEIKKGEVLMPLEQALSLLLKAAITALNGPNKCDIRNVRTDEPTGFRSTIPYKAKLFNKVSKFLLIHDNPSFVPADYSTRLNEAWVNAQKRSAA